MLKIIVIEDSLILRERLRAMISVMPNTLLVAETGSEDEARNYLEEYRPDVAIIDLRLRRGSGLSMIEHINAVHADMTMIVLTNLVQLEYRTKCMELGAHYFFDKSKGTAAFTTLLVELSESAHDRQSGLAAYG